jgi:hypothetical protein
VSFFDQSSTLIPRSGLTLGTARAGFFLAAEVFFRLGAAAFSVRFAFRAPVVVFFALAFGFEVLFFAAMRGRLRGLAGARKTRH